MVRCHDRNLCPGAWMDVRLNATANLVKRRSRLRERVACVASQCNEHCGAHKVNLYVKKGSTCGFLDGVGVPIVDWSAFADVGNVHLFPLQTQGFEPVVKKASGRSHERASEAVFNRAGRFPHDHDVRIVKTNPRNDLGSGAMKGAPDTVRHSRPQIRELVVTPSHGLGDAEPRLAPRGR